MQRCLRLLGFLSLLTFLLTPSVAAQTDARPTGEVRPTVGLVLSGGGARGFAHVGALQVIEEAGIPIDVVTGTSMGSVIGALYALGYTADSLEALVLSEDWSRLIADTPLRQTEPLERQVLEDRALLSIPIAGGGVELPTNLIAGQEIEMTLSRLLLAAYAERDFARLPRPFAAVATDLETGEAVRLSGGYLPRAVQASIAIPSLFAPVAIEGRTYIDGGVGRNLPVEDARALGADVLVCVDTSEPIRPLDSLNTFVDVLFQVVGFAMAQSNTEQETGCDVRIDPRIEDLPILGFDRADTLLARGRAAANDVRPQLDALADRLGTRGRPLTRPPLLDARAIPIAHVEIEGLTRPLGRRITRALDLGLPTKLDADAIAAAVERVYALGYFERVTYRVEPNGAGAVLVLQVQERNLRRLNFGAGYNSPFGAALDVGATFPDVTGPASLLSVRVNLGEALRLDTRLTLPLSLASDRRLFFDAAATRLPLDLFDGGDIATRLRIDALHLGARGSLVLKNRIALTAGVRSEFYDLVPTIGAGVIEGNFLENIEALLVAEGTLLRETLSPASFPTRGYRIFGQSRAALDGVASEETWLQSVGMAEARWPLGGSVSLIGEAFGGHVFGTPPLHYRFYVGGAHPYEVLPGRQLPLAGYAVYELSGTSVQGLGVGLQKDLPFNLVGALRYQVARVAENDAAFDADALYHGVAASVGLRSFLGPIALTAMAPRLTGPVSLRLKVGF